MKRHYFQFDMKKLIISKIFRFCSKVERSGLTFLFLLIQWLIIQAAFAQTPTLGHYADLTIRSGQNINVKSSIIPKNCAAIFAHSNSNFNGLITVDAATGLLRITNALIQGSFRVKVIANSPSNDTVSTSFKLTITNPLCSEGTFLESTLSVGDNPNILAIGDFNNDNFQDIIAASSDSLAYIRLGHRKDGFNFEVKPDLKFDFKLTGLMVADFNGDGNQDLAAKGTKDSISINLGNGKGEFAKSVKFKVDNIPSGFTTADYNRDGFPDIVNINQNSKSLTVSLGDGKGGFKQDSSIKCRDQPQSIVTSDFNGDGKLDLAITNNSQSYISIFFGDGLGNFQKPKDTAIKIITYYLAAGDFNHDNIQDLVVTNKSSSFRVGSFLLGLGNGQFSRIAIDVGFNVNSINTGDFNGDGNLDYATTNSSGISLYFGDGTGHFEAPFNINFGTGVTATNMVVGDFNEDGRQDLAIPFKEFRSIYLYRGEPKLVVKGNVRTIERSDSTPDFSDHTDFGTQFSSRTFTIFNRGNTGLVLGNNSISINGANASDFSVSIQPDSLIPVKGSKTFTINFKPALGEIVRVADVNIHFADCESDSNKFSFRIKAAMLPELGSFSNLSIICGQNTNFVPTSPPIYLESADIDISHRFKGTISIDKTSGILKITNASPAGIYPIKVFGYNQFSEQYSVTEFLLTVNAPVCSQGIFSKISGVSHPGLISQIQIRDFNGDNIQDLVTTDYDSNTISFYLGNGKGSFNKKRSIPTGNHPMQMVFGDFDKDGISDFAVSQEDSENVAIYMGLDDGNFDKTYEIRSDVITSAMALTYIDLQGQNHAPFLTFTNDIERTVQTYVWNKGSGFKSYEFEPFELEGGPYSLSIADFNNDKLSEILLIDASSLKKIKIFSFEPLGTNSMTTGLKPISAVVGDFNEDGFEDFATANWTSYNLSIRFGNGKLDVFPEKYISLENAPASITSGDFNGDGHLDFAMTNPISNNITIQYGNGIGGFDKGNSFDLGNMPQSLVVGDFNADGIQDIAVACKDSITVLLGAVSKMEVYGNNRLITRDNDSPTLIDSTDFGKNKRVNFVLSNKGSGQLIFNGPPVSLFGDSDFVVTMQPEKNINPNASSKFTIECKPLSLGTHTAKVIIGGDNCDTAYRFSVTATITSLTSKSYTPSAIGNQLTFEIVPNPNNGKFSLLFKEASQENLNLTLTDVLGRLLYQSEAFLDSSGILPIDFGTIEFGTYFLSVEQNGYRYIKKVVLF